MAAAPTVWDIRRAGIAHYDTLISKQNVRYMTVGYKVRDGVRLPEKSLKLYVSSKNHVAAGQMIPQRLAAPMSGGDLATVPTDVIQLDGVPCAFGLRSGHLIKAFNGDRGVCAISYLRNGAKFLLTNAHVVVDVARGGVSGPVDVLNRVDGLYYRLGNVIHASRLDPSTVTTHDVALVGVHPDFQVDQFMVLDMENDIDRIEGINTLATHDYWYRVNGRRFDCKFPERVVGTVLIDTDGVDVPYAEFWQLEMVNGSTARPGHSGALLCRMDGGDVVACGLVFGGAPAEGTTSEVVFAFPFNKMWRLMNP